MITDLVEILNGLVAVPSVNPMGGQSVGQEYYEGRLTQHLAALFDRLGLPYCLQVVEPGRQNIVARLDGSERPESGGGLILFDAHQDTVPVEGMTVDPWAPVVREGRLFGRGSCDTKGSMAAMIWAVARLAEERPPGMPTVVLSCTVNEEFGFTGARALTRSWTEPEAESCLRQVLPRRPDAAVVGEPTNLQLGIAHKGGVRWRVHTRGRAAHGSAPELGDNAIYKMARVLIALDFYQNEVVGGLASHPLCGPATINVGTVRGGISINTVPDHCVIEIDRRIPPGEDFRQARQHLIDFLAQQPGIDFPIEHEPPLMEYLALSDEANGQLAERFSARAQDVLGGCRRVGQTYATNAAYFAAAGVPAVVFGPGAPEQAHTKDEWISLDQLHRAAEVYYRFARRGLAALD